MFAEVHACLFVIFDDTWGLNIADWPISQAISQELKLGISGNQKSISARMKSHARPSAAQQRYLKLGLAQPGGKLPLFDGEGQKIPARTIRACLDAGWCEPWHANPIEPKWLVCKLTSDGENAVNETA